MKMFAVRLHEGALLKESIEQIVRENGFSAATIISAVGSLSAVRVRMAEAEPGRQDIREYDGSFEIVSLIGNLGRHRTHVHIAFSDYEGIVRGGHLKEGCIIHTTVELVLAIEDEIVFAEILDAKTGFDELSIDTRIMR